jgi:hypothetical protein
MRKLLWTSALLLGLAGTVSADTSAGDGKKGAKGKPGAACKTDADCDQKDQPQVCRQSKCQVDMPPPPT